ncbi:MAG: hypothetical protein WBX25_06080 [Rhodomicrobium sp.]
MADMAEAEIAKQTKKDLRGRLIAIFNARRDDDDESMSKGEEIILNLEGDEPHLIAAKLIITLSGEILCDLE